MQKEFRCILTNQEALTILNQAKTLESYHVIDEYTGDKRIRIKNFSEVIEKEYPTEVTGKTARIGLKIKLPGLDIPTYLEFKITESGYSRWEIEFEGAPAERFKDRENISGWQILADQPSLSEVSYG
ncbi:MAG: hypothetical protein GF365_04900 [Candidatus Buchananbacteria bacterium]|nr:hypothetical protein [Candidatus Buchananbacteria bacterium]